MTRQMALLTVTYRGDIDAFRSLCQSVDRHLPQVTHYVVHDASDAALMAPFAGPHRILIDASIYLPRFREFTLLGRRLWWYWPWHVVRGWIYQQLAKIAVVAHLQEDAVVIIDSDAVLLSPITQRHVFEGDRIRLYHRPGAPSGPASQSDLWHNTACHALGLPQRGYTGADYISTGVVWSPAVVRAMITQIAATHGGDWYKPLVRPIRFSEYVLYGVFCEHAEGPHHLAIAAGDIELAHCSWHYDLGDQQGRERFIGDLADQPILLVQSNLGMEAQQRDALISLATAEYAGQG